MQLALHAEHFKINESQKKITTVSSNDPAPLPPRTGTTYISKMFVVYMCVCVLIVLSAWVPKIEYDVKIARTEKMPKHFEH